MRIPCSHNYGVLRLFKDSRHMDEKTHSTCILFVLKGEVDKVGSWRDEFDTLEQMPNRPILVINSKLHSLWCIQQEKETHFANFRVRKFLHHCIVHHFL